MKYYLLKHYLEICHILIKKELTESDFLSFFSLSNYEYKTDLDALIEMAPYFGIRLIINNNKIIYEIKDKELYKKKYKPCSSFYSVHIAHGWENNNIKPYYIAIKFLLEDNYIKLDDISAELLCSKSALRNDVKYTREILSQYGISIVNSPYHGMKAEGAEINKRLCLDALFNFYNTHIILDSRGDTLIDDFFSDFYDQTYQQLNQIFSHYEISINQLNLRNLTRYLIIVKRQISDKKFILEDAVAHNDTFAGCIEYHIAKEILISVFGREIFEDKLENEIMGLITYIVVLREYDTTLHKSWYRLYFNDEGKVQELFQSINTQLVEQWNIHLSFREKELLYSVSIKLTLKAYFHYLSFKGIKTLGNSYSYSQYPLVKLILKEISETIKDIFKMPLKISFVQLYEIADLLLIYFTRQKFIFKKLNIAVISKDGSINRYAYYNLVESLVNPAYVNKLAELNTIDLKDSCFSDFDLVVLERNIYVRMKQDNFVRVNNKLEDINNVAAGCLDCTADLIHKVSIENFDAKNDGYGEQKNCRHVASFLASMQKSCRYVIVNKKIIYLKEVSTDTKKIVMKAGSIQPIINFMDKTINGFIYIEYDKMRINYCFLHYLLYVLTDDYMLFDDLISDCSLHSLNRSLKRYII